MIRIAMADEIAPPINYLPINHFVEYGYLQEVNRRFLHPLGLALEVQVSEGGSMTLGGIWNYTDDAEGIRFADGTMDRDKYLRVERAWQAKAELLRKAALGYVIQPPPEAKEADSDHDT
jgi:hypothetical protein